MTSRTIHLKLPGAPSPNWKDAHASDPAQAPFLVSGSAATLYFVCTNLAGTALVSPAGLSALTLEIYKDRSCHEDDLLIAPSTVSLDSGAADVTLAQWNAGTHQHFSVALTGAETNIEIDAESGGIDAWMELRGTLSAERCFLGSGPVRIHRGAAGGSVSAPALYMPASAFSAGTGYLNITIGGTTYHVPTAELS